MCVFVCVCMCVCGFARMRSACARVLLCDSRVSMTRRSPALVRQQLKTELMQRGRRLSSAARLNLLLNYNKVHLLPRSAETRAEVCLLYLFVNEKITFAHSFLRYTRGF